MRVQISHKAVFRTLCLLGGLLVFAGCGKRTTEISGVVKMKGEVIPVGEITFMDEDGRVDTSQIKDGAYVVYRAPVGKVKITVKSVQPAPYVNRHGRPMKPPDESIKGADPEMKGVPKYVPIPKKYESMDTTNLTYEVKSGKQEYNI